LVPGSTLVRFGAWNVIGLLAYFLYGRLRSEARREAAAA
jgi:basic amino acid/polyamine antiporter, APA family